jgi:ribonuclease P protein component
VVWKENKLNSDYPAQVAITVSKRSFKHAVKRNLMKRRIREIYRLNKHKFYKELQERDTQIAFMIVYLPKTIMKTSEMDKKLIKALERLPKEYDKFCKSNKKRNSISDDSTD